MYQKLFNYLKNRPTLYAPSTSKFWDDEHISKGMLEAHLNPDIDPASRNHAFIDRSVEWISKITYSSEYRKILDLGCGPGINAERFAKSSCQVTGIDFSKRSIQYAIASARRQELDIEYRYQDYLSIAYDQEFDVATLIYCDFGVLSGGDRAELLRLVNRSLKPGGTFVFDVFNPNQYKGIEEYRRFSYSEGGFWCEEPYTVLESLYRYDESNTFLRQYLVLSEDETRCYNIWEHTFTTDELLRDLTEAGFGQVIFYGDVAGADYHAEGNIICAVAHKPS
jgi:SAM-dependent methyltransferase